MSKEFEALKTIKNFLGYNYCSVDLPNELKCVEQALQRLEVIDNANPSKAINYLDQFLNEMTNCLENPKEYAKGYEKEIFYKYKHTLETIIKQALIKAQEQEKVLEIIKHKKPNLYGIYLAPKVEQYNRNIFNIGKDRQLTKEEFNLLKRYFGNGRN